jgi:hypothetical protein
VAVRFYRCLLVEENRLESEEEKKPKFSASSAIDKSECVVFPGHVAVAAPSDQFPTQHACSSCMQFTLHYIRIPMNEAGEMALSSTLTAADTSLQTRVSFTQQPAQLPVSCCSLRAPPHLACPTTPRVPHQHLACPPAPPAGPHQHLACPTPICAAQQRASSQLQWATGRRRTTSKRQTTSKRCRRHNNWGEREQASKRS